MNELRSLREKNNYTCKEMADKLKISKPFYWQIENKSTFPTAPGISPSSFLLARASAP